MKINLSTEKGIEKLQQELEHLQKNCRARTVTAAEVVEAASKIVEKLAISKKALNGSRVCMDLNAKNLMSYLNSIPESTIVSMEFSSNHWVVTDIRRDRTHREGHNVDIVLSDTAREAIVERFSSFGI